MKIDLCLSIVLYCYVVHQYRGRGADKGRTGDSQGEGSGVAFTEACLLQAHFVAYCLPQTETELRRAFIQHVLLQLLLGAKTVPVCKDFAFIFLPLTFSLGMFAVSHIFLVLRMQINCSRCFEKKKS